MRVSVQAPLRCATRIKELPLTGKVGKQLVYGCTTTPALPLPLTSTAPASDAYDVGGTLATKGDTLTDSRFDRASTRQPVLPVSLAPEFYLYGGLAHGYAIAPVEPSKDELVRPDVLPVASSWPLHTRLDWSELVWDASGVSIRGVHYPLIASRTTPNTPLMRPLVASAGVPLGAVSPVYNIRTNSVVEYR